MSVFSRLLRTRPDPREALRPLWHEVVAASRAEHWYREGGVADTVAGRFDMIVAMLALVLLRLERDPAIAHAPALLTELFVEDMDRQLRETGVGDLVVGKHVGRLVSVLGGRLGAFRDALETPGADGADFGGNAAGADTGEHHRDQKLRDAVTRNVTLLADRDAAPLGRMLREWHQRLAAHDTAALLAARLPA